MRDRTKSIVGSDPIQPLECIKFIIINTLDKMLVVIVLLDLNLFTKYAL